MKIPQHKPVYKLSERFFDPHDILHEVDEVIIFTGTPNQGMIPMNDLAREAYDKYIDQLDAGLKAACEAQTPPVHFVPHARIYDEPTPEIADVSKDVDPRVQPTKTLHLGQQVKKDRPAAETVR